MNNNKVRQKIIDYLFSKVTYSEIDVPKLTATLTELKAIAVAIDIPYETVFLAHHGIPDNQARCVAENGKHNMVLVQEGINASIDQFWIKQWRKEQNEDIFARTKWMAPIIAIIISVISAYYAISKVSATEAKLKAIQEQIDRSKV